MACRIKIKLISVMLCPLLLMSCTAVFWQPYIFPRNTIPTEASVKYVKCHMKNHELYLLENWIINEEKMTISGTGAYFGIKRNLIERGKFELKLTNIALLETNFPEEISVGGKTAMAVMLGLTGMIALFCLSNPKACFGSCPTFYAYDGEDYSLQAEGFSSSIAPAFEKTDIDALYLSSTPERTVDVIMRNEALETHAVRNIQLIAVERPKDGRVYQTQEGIFYATDSQLAPVTCQAENGDVLDKVIRFDDNEYYSLTDSSDLLIEEMLELEFPAIEGDVGLVVSTRNTLLNTFLFYQSIAYMGSNYFDYLVNFDAEHAATPNKNKSMLNLLGNIKVFTLNENGNERFIGEIGETGPIATEVKLLPIPDNDVNNPMKLRLRMTRGNWRINHISLAEITGEITPLKLSPVEVLTEESDEGTLSRINDPAEYLYTYPGDEYTFRFQLPDTMTNPELFLVSTGYYYEWMRAEWIDEEDPSMLYMVLNQPELALKKLAGRYKEIEDSMESHFWNSKYGRLGE